MLVDSDVLYIIVFPPIFTLPTTPTPPFICTGPLLGNELESVEFTINVDVLITPVTIADAALTRSLTCKFPPIPAPPLT